MSGAAQMRIMEWPIDESRFSGGHPEDSDAVQKYTREVSQRYKAISHSSALEGAGNADVADLLFDLPRGLPVMDDLEEALSQMANILDRVPEAASMPSVTFTPMQEWEGFITSFDGEIFTAKFCDVKDLSGVPTEEAEFDIRELAPDDRGRVRLGAIVRWAVGLERHSNDRRQRVSRIHLRRLPVFTKSDVDSARHSADELLELLAI